MGEKKIREGSTENDGVGHLEAWTSRTWQASSVMFGEDGGIGAEMVGLGSGWFGDTTTDIGMSPLLVIAYHRGRGKARPYFQSHHCCREYPTTRLILEISVGAHPRQSAGVERSPHRLTQPIKLN